SNGVSSGARSARTSTWRRSSRWSTGSPARSRTPWSPRSSTPACSIGGATSPNDSGCAWSTSPSCSRARSGRPRPPSRRTARERGLRVVFGDRAAPVVVQREPVAGGLGGRLLPEPLAQVPVHPFVQVQEPEHLALGAERDALG